MKQIKRILEALAAGCAVYVTDGTVTRQVLEAVEECSIKDLRLSLDNGKFLWLDACEFENGSNNRIDLMDSAEGLYIAPLWWINSGEACGNG